MAAQADGTVLINTEIKKDGAIEDISTLKEALQQLTTAVKDLTAGLANSFGGIGKRADSAADQIDKISSSAKKAEANVESLEEQMAKITVDHGFQPKDTDNEAPRFSHERGEFEDYSKSVEKFINDYASGMDKVEESTNEFKAEISSLSKQLKDLESQGFYFGDDQYDETYMKLAKVKQALVDYKKEMLSPAESPKINMESLQGQVDSLKRKLQQLTDQGKTFGDSLYDSTYQSLTKAQAELNGYKKNLTAPVKIPVDLDQDSFAFQIQQLKAKLAELGKQGITLGNPQYDSVYAELQRVTQAEKEYKKSLLDADQGQKMVKKSADRMNKSMDKAGKSAKSAGKGMSALKMLGTSILFSFVFQAISAITGAVKEGFDNLSRYSKETNGTLSLLKSSLTTLKNSFAAAFSPILTLVAPALNKLIGLLVDVNNWIAQTMAALTGKNTFVKAVAVQEDYAASLSDTKKAAKEAAKEVKKASFAFDTLIQLQKPGDTDTYTGPTPDQMFETKQVSEDAKAMADNIGKALDTIKDKVLEIGDISKKGFLSGLGNYKPLLKELSKDLGSIGTNLKEIITDADVMTAAKRFVTTFIDMVGKLAGSLASVGLTVAANVVGGIESYLSKNTERIKAWLIRMFNIGTEINTVLGDFFVAFSDVFSVFASQTAQDITGSIIQIFSDVFAGVLELTSKFVRDILDIMLTPFTENKDRIKQSISETLEPIKTVVETIATVVRKLVDGIMELYDAHVHPLFVSIRDGLSKLMKIFLDAYNEYIVPVLDNLAKKFKEVMEGPVGDAIDSTIKLLGKLIDVIKLLWEKAIVPYYEGLMKTIIPILAPAIETIGNVFLDVFGGIAESVSALFDLLSSLIDFIVGVFTGDWKRAWEGIKGVFSSVWKGMEAIVKAVTKSIQDLANGLVKTVTTAVEKILDVLNLGEKKAKSSTLNGVGGGGRTFSLSANTSTPYAAYANNVPMLATGTVVPPKAGNFLAMLGDNNKDYEVVSPLGTIKQAVLEAIGEAGGLGGGTVQADLIVDGTKFGQLVYKYNNNETQRVGVRMVTNGG